MASHFSSLFFTTATCKDHDPPSFSQVVTGGCGSLGLAVSLQLADAGATVFAGCHAFPGALGAAAAASEDADAEFSDFGGDFGGASGLGTPAVGGASAAASGGGGGGGILSWFGLGSSSAVAGAALPPPPLHGERRRNAWAAANEAILSRTWGRCSCTRMSKVRR